MAFKILARFSLSFLQLLALFQYWQYTLFQHNIPFFKRAIYPFSTHWKTVIYPQQQSLLNKHSDYVDEMNGIAFLFVLLKVPFVAILILFHRYREWEFNHPSFLGTIRNGNVLHCSANGNVLQHQEPKSKFVCWFCKQKFIDS